MYNIFISDDLVRTIYETIASMFFRRPIDDCIDTDDDTGNLNHIYDLRFKADAQSNSALKNFKIVHGIVSKDITPKPLQASSISLPLPAWGPRGSNPSNSFGRYIQRPKQFILDKT